MLAVLVFMRTGVLVLDIIDSMVSETVVDSIGSVFTVVLGSMVDEDDL